MPMHKPHPMHGPHHLNQKMMPYESLNNRQVVKVLSTANTDEIMQANVALPKLQSSQVCNYVQMMINEHSMNDQKGQALSSRLGIVP